MIEKLFPTKTVWEVGDIVRFDGAVVVTNVAVLMLTSTLLVEPPFFLTLMLVDEICMAHEGGPLAPPTPVPDTSMHGVLSAGEGPGIAVCNFMLVLALTALYVTLGN